MTDQEILGIVAKPISDNPVKTEIPSPSVEPVISENSDNSVKTEIPTAEAEINEPDKPTIPVQEINPQNLIADLGIPVTEPQTETKRGPGRPRGTRNKSTNGDLTADDVPQVDYALMSSMCFDMSTNALSMIFGPEWQPNSDQEKNAVVTSLATYLRTKQVKDIPPGMMLCFIVAVYSAPRLRHQTTGGKIKLWFLWIKSKLTRKKLQPFNPSIA